MSNLRKCHVALSILGSRATTTSSPPPFVMLPCISPNITYVCFSRGECDSKGLNGFYLCLSEWDCPIPINSVAPGLYNARVWNPRRTELTFCPMLKVLAPQRFPCKYLLPLIHRPTPPQLPHIHTKKRGGGVGNLSKEKNEVLRIRK